MSRLGSLLVVLALATSAVPAFAWKGESGGPARTIAEVHAKGEEGDVVTIEGEITDVGDGGGSLRIAVVEDDSGQLEVAIAEYLRRSIEREPGEDPTGARVRVTGTWEHDPLEPSEWRLRATAIEVLARP